MCARSSPCATSENPIDSPAARPDHASAEVERCSSSSADDEVAGDTAAAEGGDGRSAASGAVVYHAICKEGEGELHRSTSALAWSGQRGGRAVQLVFPL